MNMYQECMVNIGHAAIRDCEQWSIDTSFKLSYSSPAFQAVSHLLQLLDYIEVTVLGVEIGTMDEEWGDKDA